MDWSRAKTLLIILLVALNIFLLTTFIARESELQNDEREVKQNIQAIAKKQGFEISAEIIPSDTVKIYPVTISEQVSFKSVAEKILGNVTETASENGKVYSGKSGSLLTFDDSFSLVYESGSEIKDKKGAIALAKDLTKALGISEQNKKLECTETDSGYLIICSELLSGVEVFDCATEIMISKSGSVIARGKLLAEKSTSRPNDEIYNISSLLLTYIDIMKSKGKTDVKVTEISLGYTSKAPASGIITLAPTVRIKSDFGSHYIDMMTGEEINI